LSAMASPLLLSGPTARKSISCPVALLLLAGQQLLTEPSRCSAPQPPIPPPRCRMVERVATPKSWSPFGPTVGLSTSVHAVPSLRSDSVCQMPFGLR